MDLSTDLQAGTAHLIPHIILDQITETTATPAAMTHTTDKDTTGTTIEIGDTNITQDINRETKTTKTGMITIKIETGSTTEGDQTNINITETNQRHKSSLNIQTRIYWKLCRR